MNLGATSKKMVVLGGGSRVRGGGVGVGARPQLFCQKITNFLFFVPFDAEAFKTCKNTIKLKFVFSTLSGVVKYMTPADSDCVLLLGLASLRLGRGGCKKIHFQI